MMAGSNGGSPMKTTTRETRWLLLALCLGVLALTGLGVSERLGATVAVRASTAPPKHPTLEPPQGPLFAGARAQLPLREQRSVSAVDLAEVLPG
jgi:hypothetical protein